MSVGLPMSLRRFGVRFFQKIYDWIFKSEIIWKQILRFFTTQIKSKSPHKNQTKSNFLGKAWKLNFAPLLHIANPKQEYKKPVFFFLEIVLSFREKQHFRFTLQPASTLSLASPNWVKNRPFSFDSQVATIECSKIVMQPTYCIMFPHPKPTISRILD